ncbi:hypothetical protein [Thermogemmatispora sp.]|uniref:hypothetical protein n=1 Tax=Thermogemmatispora sp. TaxID=1968838 RepID=UPI001D27F0C6|nr:hypothetical protein [Thermogemmatispora sp.]MBX5450828.1 hypothetical protein [Thermogemmatispora sp.]
MSEERGRADLQPLVKVIGQIGPDTLLCLGALGGAGVLFQAETSLSWSIGVMLVAGLLLLNLLGQLLLFLMAYKLLEKIWYRRRQRPWLLRFPTVSATILRGYIRAMVGELGILCLAVGSGRHGLALLSIFNASFPIMLIIATVATALYRRQEARSTLLQVLCLGFGLQLLLSLLVRLL